MALRPLPVTSLHEVIRAHLVSGEDAETTALSDRLRAASRRGYLTKGELEAACRWKSARASGRVKRNSAQRIREATRLAFASRSETRRMAALVALDGVSVPTGSAILTLVNPRRYGVIDIRVWQLLNRMGAVEGNPHGTGLTVAHWECFLNRIREFAQVFGVSARAIERALFHIHRGHQSGRLYDRAR